MTRTEKIGFGYVELEIRDCLPAELIQMIFP